MSRMIHTYLNKYDTEHSLGLTDSQSPESHYEPLSLSPTIYVYESPDSQSARVSDLRVPDPQYPQGPPVSSMPGSTQTSGLSGPHLRVTLYRIVLMANQKSISDSLKTRVSSLIHTYNKYELPGLSRPVLLRRQRAQDHLLQQARSLQQLRPLPQILSLRSML